MCDGRLLSGTFSHLQSYVFKNLKVRIQIRGAIVIGACSPPYLWTLFPAFELVEFHDPHITLLLREYLSRFDEFLTCFWIFNYLSALSSNFVQYFDKLSDTNPVKSATRTTSMDNARHVRLESNQSGCFATFRSTKLYKRQCRKWPLLVGSVVALEEVNWNSWNARQRLFLDSVHESQIVVVERAILPEFTLAIQRGPTL